MEKERYESPEIEIVELVLEDSIATRVGVATFEALWGDKE